MLKTRLIPVVLMRNGVCVQSKGFRRYQRLGDPITIVERLSAWASDELCYLDRCSLQATESASAPSSCLSNRSPASNQREKNPHGTRYFGRSSMCCRRNRNNPSRARSVLAE